MVKIKQQVLSIIPAAADVWHDFGLSFIIIFFYRQIFQKPPCNAEFPALLQESSADSWSSYEVAKPEQMA